MQRTMADLTSANSTYLSASVEDTELDSINFRQSLRFFQDQLILNSKEFPSPTRVATKDMSNQFDLHFTDEQNPIEKHINFMNRDRVFDEMSKPLNSNKISIPTVDTILESVRVLRAIQKSQEQRGSSWSLNMSQSESDLILEDPLTSDNSSDEDLNVFHDSQDVLSTSIDINASDCSDAISCPKNLFSARSNETESFWPSHRIVIPESVATDNTEVLSPKQNNIHTDDGNDRLETACMGIVTEYDGIENALENWEKTRGKNLQDISEENLYKFTESGAHETAIEEETFSQTNLHSVSTDSGYTTVSSTSDDATNLHIDWRLDSAEVSALQSSKIVTEVCKMNGGENGNILDSSYDIEQDGAFEKDDSSLEINKKIEIPTSPMDTFSHQHLRSESRSDTCSSHYMSAECSPCASLHNEFEPASHTEESNQAYTEECENTETKKDSLLETRQSISSISSTSTDTNTDDCLTAATITAGFQVPLTVFNDGSKNEELSNNTSAVTENINTVNSGEKSYHSCSLLEFNDTSPCRAITETTLNSNDLPNLLCEKVSELSSTISTLTENIHTVNSAEDSCNSCSSIDLNSTTGLRPATTKTPVHSDDLPNFSDTNRTYEVSENYYSANILNGNDLRTGEKIAKEFQTNKFQNTINISEQKDVNDDKNEIHAVKKITTSSWNLEAFVELLYILPAPKASKVFPVDTKFQREVFVIAQGAFFNYPEGEYTLELQQQSIVIMKETNVLLSMFLIYADVNVNGNILQLDNKLGRQLYIKCRTEEELVTLKEELEMHLSKCRASECINLVHYPLKCHQNVIVIDLGSCSTRAGILMDQSTLPFIFFPSICATDKITGNRVYGKEALKNDVRQNSNLSFPLRPSNKIIKHSVDVNLLGGLFKKIFHDLRVDPTQYTIQVCLPRSLSIQTQNELVKLLLEDLKVESVNLTHQALLTLYAHNVSTGIVVDVGDRMDILPVVDGFIVENGVTRIPYGGQRLIHHMKHALAEKHISLSNNIDSFVVQFITENLSYVAEDYENETKIAIQRPDMVRKSIKLDTFTRDNNCLQYAVLDDARFKVPEGLFKPSLWGLDHPGIHHLVQKAIQATSVDVRRKIAENIYVSGGITLTPGFVERLHKEVSNLNKPRITPKVIASQYRYHCTYIGACEFARMEVFPKVCVNAEEYRKKQLSALKKFILCF